MASSSSSLFSFSSPAAAKNLGCGLRATMSAASVRCHPMCISASCTTTTDRPPRTFGSLHIPSLSSLYEVLGISSGATCQEIKAAYRRLARVLHPDVAVEDDTMGREFMMVHEAYATLSDPDKRADYDSEMMLVSPRPHPSPIHAGYGSGFQMRNWETDQCW